MDKEEIDHVKRWIVSIGWGNLRGWPHFVERFNIPEKNWAQIEKRVVPNLVYFATNYLYVTFVVFAYFLFSRPAFLLSVLVSCVVLLVASAPPRELQARLAPYLPTENHRLVAAAIIGVLLITLSGSLLLTIGLLCVSAAVILVHALLRPVPHRAQASHTATRLQVAARSQIHSFLAGESEQQGMQEVDMEAMGGEGAPQDVESFGQHGTVGEAPSPHTPAVPSSGMSNLPRPGVGASQRLRKAPNSGAGNKTD